MPATRSSSNMPVTADALRQVLQNPPTDPKERKELYNACQQIVYGLETAQDTAQRLYHGVRVQVLL